MSLRFPLMTECEEYVAVAASYEDSPKKSARKVSARPPYVSCGMSADAVRGPSPQSPSKHITVVDVYDLAALIGKDFEHLIEIYGNDSVRGIMPKVISALETLEALANNNERENDEIITLQKSIERLEKEKKERIADRLKFEEELDLVEENYRKEINELGNMVKELMSENRSLSSTVSSLPENAESPTQSASREADVKRNFELKEECHRQKEEIKILHKDVAHYICEVENLTNSIDKLIRQNEELLRKNGSLQKQGRMIVEEKMEIMKRLERTEEANIQLRKLLSDTDRACKDLQQQNACDDEPRFTLAELREVLQEKNILKGRVMELEEEIDQLRPGGVKRERFDTEEPEEKPSTSEAGEDDLPVYGPLPREPEEKLYPWKYERNNSGVRKFFRFFKDLGGARVEPSTPRRNSSQSNSPRPVRSLAGLTVGNGTQ